MTELAILLCKHRSTRSQRRIAKCMCEITTKEWFWWIFG